MKLGLVGCVLLLAACPADETPEAEGSGSGSGSGSASASGPNTGDPPDTPDPPEACEDLEAPATTDVELRVTNQRADPIFVDAGCGATLLLSQVGGTASFAADTCDAPTCESSLEGDCSMACAACIPGVLRIEPGASYTQTWAGSIFNRVDIAGFCELCSDECWQEHTAPDGDYQLRANVFLECPETLDDCECPAGEEPPCFIEAYDGAVNAEERTVDFAMPNDGPIELLID